MAKGAFFSSNPGKKVVKGAGILVSSKAMAFSAVRFWGSVQSGQQLRTYFLRFSTLTVCFGSTGKCEGNEF
jgi:hypothetical protein